MADQAEGGVAPGGFAAGPSAPCTQGLGGPFLRPSGCTGARDCALGEVCCLDLSGPPQGVCVQAGSACTTQLCADSQECSDAGACSAVADSGLKACGWNGWM